MRGENIFITGKPRSGKSTLIAELIEGIDGEDHAGILTPELRERGRRTGFEIVDLRSGEREILASVNIEGPRVSKYGVNVEGIDRIVSCFSETADDADMIFIDEIGRMEFYSRDFEKVLEEVLRSDKTVIGTLHRHYVKRFNKYGTVLKLTGNNRDEIRRRVWEILGEQ